MNYLGLSTDKVNSTVKELNQLLSNYQIYYQNLRNFHWNVSGENFFDLHEKFEDLYTDARTKIDEIAERILTLRRTPVSKYSDYIDRADVQEAEILTDDHEMMEIILKNHGTIIKNFRRVLKEAEDAGDEGTTDLIGGFLFDLEKESWMLDAWIKKMARVEII